MFCFSSVIGAVAHIVKEVVANKKHNIKCIEHVVAHRDSMLYYWLYKAESMSMNVQWKMCIMLWSWKRKNL